MVVRRHTVFLAEIIVREAVIAHIHEEEQIVSAHGGLDHALAVSGGKAGAAVLDEEGIVVHTGAFCPADQMRLNLLGKLLCTRKRYDAERGHPILSTEKRL